MDHILFPLPERQSGEPWEKENWEIHGHPTQNIDDVERQVRNMNGLIIEVVYHKLGFYLIERRFMPSGGDSWDLIYYSERTNLEDWEKQYEGSGIEVRTGKG